MKGLKTAGVGFLAAWWIPVTLALWPMPRSLETGSTYLKLSPTFDITLDIAQPPGDLLSAAQQTKLYLKNDKLQPLIVGRGSSDTNSVEHAISLSSLHVSLLSHGANSSISEEAVLPFGTKDEAYTLTVPTNGSAATLFANSTLGLYRGLTTFSQLWYYSTQTQATYTSVAPINIVDSPAYPYRGFMLDTARNFFPVSDIKRTIDAMSWVKMSVFHWHITDSQSFPLGVAQFPELAEYGAYSSSEIYSPSDIQEITAYAAARGIDVLLEIDTPGHTASISASHPDYVACNVASPWADYANEPPAGQLRFASPNVTSFVASLFTDVAKLLPGQYFSTGGDELNTECYVDDPETQKILNSTGQTLEQALNVFIETTHGALTKQGKTPVVWEEMVLVQNVTLTNDTIVMVWISSEDAAAVAEKGYRIVQAPSNYFYLDCGAGEWIGDDPTGNSWCDPFKTWSYSYTFDPLANLTEAQYDLVLGGEQLLWTEQSSPENLDSIVWPRAASSAEIFWTGTNPPLNVSSALPRLHDLRFRMVQRGLKPIVLQPYWCAIRPHACDLYA